MEAVDEFKMLSVQETRQAGVDRLLLLFIVPSPGMLFPALGQASAVQKTSTLLPLASSM